MAGVRLKRLDLVGFALAEHCYIVEIVYGWTLDECHAWQGCWQRPEFSLIRELTQA
jgi:hypothetical protein